MVWIVAYKYFYYKSLAERTYVTLGLLKSLSAYALRHRISLRVRVDLRASGSGPVTVTEVINDILLLSTRFPYCRCNWF
jgi:hypothetical protein